MVSIDETLRQKVQRLLGMYPGRVSLTEVAILLGISKGAVTKYHSHKLPYLQVEGIKLYDEKVVRAYAKARRRVNTTSRVQVTGIEVERLQRICEKYYRQNLDIGPSELLALAKRIAKL